jgi:hypothetical protein
MEFQFSRNDAIRCLGTFYRYFCIIFYYSPRDERFRKDIVMSKPVMMACLLSTMLVTTAVAAPPAPTFKTITLTDPGSNGEIGGMTASGVPLATIQTQSAAAAAAAAAAQTTANAAVPTAGGNASATLVTTNGPTALSEAARWGTVIDAREYGLVADGTTDDWWAIQQAIQKASSNGGGTVLIPRINTNIVRVAQAIREASHVTLLVAPGVMIKCTGDYAGTDPTGAHNLGQWPTGGCLLAGGGESGTLNAIPLLAAGAVKQGQTVVTLNSGADAATIVAGDLVLVQSTTQYAIGSTWRPQWSRMAQVVSINSTALTLDRPMDPGSTPFATTYVQKLTNGAGTAGWPTVDNSNIPMWATIGPQVIGGDWVGTAALMPFEAGGGALDCVEALRTVTAASGGAGGGSNLHQNCIYSAISSTIINSGIELAYSSKYNRVDVGTITSIGSFANRQGPSWMVSVDESAVGNYIHVASVQAYNYNTPYLSMGGTPNPAGGDVLNLSVVIPGSSTVNVSLTTNATSGASLAAAEAAFITAANTALAGTDITLTASPYYTGTILTKSASGVAYMPNASATGATTFYTPGQGVGLINVAGATNNTILVDSVTGSNVMQNVAEMSSGVAANPTTGNTIRVGTSNVNYQYAYGQMSGAYTGDNTISSGRFNGELFQPQGFQFNYGVGSNNLFSDVRGFGSTATIGCNQIDPSNLFKEVYTTLSEPETNSSNFLVPLNWCAHKAVSSASWNAISKINALGSSNFGIINITSGTYLGTNYAANTIENFDEGIVTARGFKSGTAGVVTGYEAFQGCAATFSIPADATYWEVIMKAAYLGSSASGSTNCYATTTSTSTAHPGSVMTASVGYQSPATSGGGAINFNAPTSGDYLQLRHLSINVRRPSYDNTVVQY